MSLLGMSASSLPVLATRSSMPLPISRWRAAIRRVRRETLCGQVRWMTRELLAKSQVSVCRRPIRSPGRMAVWSKFGERLLQVRIFSQQIDKEQEFVAWSGGASPKSEIWSFDKLLQLPGSLSRQFGLAARNQHWFPSSRRAPSSPRVRSGHRDKQSSRAAQPEELVQHPSCRLRAAAHRVCVRSREPFSRWRSVPCRPHRNLCWRINSYRTA